MSMLRLSVQLVRSLIVLTISLLCFASFVHSYAIIYNQLLVVGVSVPLDRHIRFLVRDCDTSDEIKIYMKPQNLSYSLGLLQVRWRLQLLTTLCSSFLWSSIFDHGRKSTCNRYQYGKWNVALKWKWPPKGVTEKLCSCWTKSHLNVLNRIRYYLIVERGFFVSCFSHFLKITSQNFKIFDIAGCCCWIRQSRVKDVTQTAVVLSVSCCFISHCCNITIERYFLIEVNRQSSTNCFYCEILIP